MAEEEKPTGEQKEKQLHELLTSAMVDIYVGPESTHWPLHERLLCYHSPFLASVFYDKNTPSRPGSNKSYGLPEEDDRTFELLVGWLYSRSIRAPTQEKDIGPLLDLYLLSDRLEMEKLGNDVVDTIREYYHSTSTYPGLRRVQYIYANTSEDNAMREMLVNCVARYLALADTIPNHWAKALKRNGELAVDIIRSIQEWHLESRSIPDVRDGSTDRGRAAKGFSAVEEDRGTSMETAGTVGTEGSFATSEEIGGKVEKSEKYGTEDPPRRPLPPRPPDTTKVDIREGEDERRVRGVRRGKWLLPLLGKWEYVALSLFWFVYAIFTILTYG